MPSVTPQIRAHENAFAPRGTAVVALVAGAVLLTALVVRVLTGLALDDGTVLTAFAGAALLGLVLLFSGLYARSRDAEARELMGRIRDLQAREQGLLALLDNVEGSVVAVDAGQRITACNLEFATATERLAGVRAAPGVHFEELIRPEKRALFGERLRQVGRGEPSREVISFETANGPVHREISFRALWRDGVVDGFTFEGRDVTARIEAERRLREANRRLVDVSRRAGMEQVATGILHEAGNVLNSVNVAADQIESGLRDLPIEGVGKAAIRLEAAGEARLANYLARLHEIQKERVQSLRDKARTLTLDVEHIRSVVASQHHRAGAAGAIEPISLGELADTAVDLHAERIQNLGIAVERDHDAVGPIETDRHRVLQILGNVVGNACDALEGVHGGRRLRIRTRRVDDEVLVEVEDDGIGIPPENLRRVFEHGFTTKQDGHGFSLHESANAAGQLGGRMVCASEGLGRGACVTLALPAREGAPA